MTFRGPPSASAPSQGRNGVAEHDYYNISLQTPRPGIGQPFSTRCPQSPLPRVPVRRSLDEDSVFTYTPPPQDQPEWEQYYYYPDDTQSVTPGHAMGDSYFATHSSPSLGLRRQRQTEFADPQQPPPSARPPSGKDSMGGFNLQPPPKPVVGPRRESYMQADPRSAATSERDAYTHISPGSEATVKPATPKPTGRRLLHVDYEVMYGPAPLTPRPKPKKRVHVDPELGVKKKRLIPYVSLSQLNDPKLNSLLRDEPTPKKKPELEEVQEKQRQKKRDCCDMLLGHTFRDKQGHLIATSTPQISTTRFGLASVSPIMKAADTSSRFYDPEDSLLYDKSGNSLSESHTSKTEKFERAYLDERLESSPLQKRKVIHYENILSPDFSKKVSQFKHTVPDMPIDWVQTLNSRSFHSYIDRQDMLVVMFHNTATNQPGPADSLTKHSLKAPSGVKPEFASVDCAEEKKLCATEGIKTTPFYKVYSRGILVNAVKDFGMLNY